MNLRARIMRPTERNIPYVFAFVIVSGIILYALECFGWIGG